MKRMVLATLVLSWGALVQAGPVTPQQVPANAAWLGHLNAEAIRNLPIAKKWHERLAACPCSAKMKECFDRFGLNPLDDVLGATLYGVDFGPKSGVLVVNVRKYNLDKILEFFKNHSVDHDSTQAGSHTVYSCTLAHRSHKMTLAGAFPSDKLIVVGACPKRVEAALEILAGKKPALAKDSPLIKGIPAGALFAAIAPSVPEAVHSSAKCPVLRTCAAARVVWAENKGQLSGRYELTTVSAEMAKNFKAIVDGFQALAALRCGDQPTVSKLLSGVKCEAQGAKFSFSFQAAFTDIEAAAKAAHEKRKDHHGPCPLGGKCPLGVCPLGKGADGKCPCPVGKCTCPPGKCACPKCKCAGGKCECAAGKCTCPPGKCACPSCKCACAPGKCACPAGKCACPPGKCACPNCKGASKDAAGKK